MSSDSFISFPCLFPIKVIGKTDPAFEAATIDIVRKYSLEKGEIITNYSRKGRYLAITVNVYATSQQQLNTIYQKLTEHKSIIMVL